MPLANEILNIWTNHNAILFVNNKASTCVNGPDDEDPSHETDPEPKIKQNKVKRKGIGKSDEDPDFEPDQELESKQTKGKRKRVDKPTCPSNKKQKVTKQR